MLYTLRVKYYTDTSTVKDLEIHVYWSNVFKKNYKWFTWPLRGEVVEQ